MEAVAGLLVMLLGVCHGVETRCDGRQDGAQCYGALGGTVDIQLMDSSSKIHQYEVFKNSSKILYLRNNTVVPNFTKNRCVFIPNNRTLRINNLSISDSGKYTLQTYDSEGQSSGEQTLQLFVQAPVSSVLLLSECLSQGEMRVSCSSEGGDSPQYSWTLDGRTLTDAELLSGDNESNNITLKQHVSGHLVCSVRNNVNNVSKEQRISTCGFIFINCTSVNGTQISGWVHKDKNTLCVEPTHNPDAPWHISNLPLIAGVLAALIIFTVVGVAVACAKRKKENSKPTRREEKHGQEEMCADVRDVTQQPMQMERRPEVEYGQVKSVKRPRKTETTADDCLYANVPKAR